MVNIINKIVKSQTAPAQTNVLWDDGENLKIYRNGIWENTNSTEIKEGSIPFECLAEDIKGNFYGKYGLNNYLGELVDTNPLFIKGPRTFIYMLANNKIYRFGQSVYKVTLSGNGPSIAITGSQTSKGWTFTASGDTVALYEVKFYANKIDVETPTPDWNAQEGEAGYIENKPITKKFIKEQSMEFSDVDDWDSVYNGYEACPSNTTVARVFVDITTHEGEHITTTVIVQNDNYVYILNDDENYLQITMYNTSEGISMNVSASFRCSGTLKCHYYEEFKQLDEDYIPDTILKTTPQALSTAGKNQALSNLGIDPVVLRYLCNPYIIEPVSVLPDYLIQLLLNRNPLILNLCKIKVEVDVYDDFTDTTRPKTYFCTPMINYFADDESAAWLECIIFYDNTYHTYYASIDTDGYIYDIIEKQQ